MRLVLDVVDLLLLHEVWSRRPVVTAFTRLEGRQTVLPTHLDFNVDQLLPRLARLKQSPVWRANRANLTNDPARMPMRDLSEAYWSEMYPEVDSGAAARQSLFQSAYSRFIVAHYSGEVEQAQRLFQATAKVRHIDPQQCLDDDLMPRHGSPEWIPVDITDEIRALDLRYDPAEPGLPAAYVVSDHFWSLFIKATEAEIDQSARLNCPTGDASCIDRDREALTQMMEVAASWYRSPSVVGLCYQLPS